MYYLELDTKKPHEGLTLLGHAPEDIQHGRTVLSNYAFSRYYGEVESWMEALDVNKRIGRFLSSLDYGLPYVQTAQILQQDETFPVVDRHTRIGLAAQDGQFVQRFNLLDTMEEVNTDPQVVALQTEHGYNAVGYGIDVTDPELREFYILGHCYNGDEFIPSAEPINVAFNALVDKTINAILR